MRGPYLPTRDRRRTAVSVGVGCLLTASLSTIGGAASLAATPDPAGHSVAAASSVPAYRRDPAVSVAPSSRFFAACWAVGPTVAAQRACEQAALPEFDRARAAEGLAPMTLPGDFASLSARHQLLVLTNIERADRGLAVYPGLSPRLDRVAAQGARAGTDPPFPSPFPGDVGFGNWAGVGSSTLLADYIWMYDDGLNSPNTSCTRNSRSDCWGHRHGIIAALRGPRSMGAAAARHGTSITEEFIGGDHGDPATSLRWSRIARRLAVGVSTTHLTVPAGAGGSGQRTLSVWASGKAMSVSLRISSGGSTWSVSPSRCRLAAGTSCVVTVHDRAVHGTASTATLSVAGPNGTRSVTLSGVPIG
jgi:hypothetical protein